MSYPAENCKMGTAFGKVGVLVMMLLPAAGGGGVVGSSLDLDSSFSRPRVHALRNLRHLPH